MTMEPMLASDRRDTGRPVQTTRRFGTEQRAALRRHWQDELADEARRTDPFERMAGALLVFASAVSILLAGGATTRFVGGLEHFAAWVQRLVS